MDATTTPTFCPTCGDTAEWCSTFRAELRAQEAAKDAAILARKAAPVRKPRKRLNKAQALVDMGECRTLAEARAYLRDMGEYR